MISAKIIKDSISEVGKRITTFEIEYPRWILAEINTHRATSKNSSSSRAVPVAAMIKAAEENPALPVWWGKSQAGMQADQQLDESSIEKCKAEWLIARDFAVQQVKKLLEIGLHKQTANRILEPFCHMKTVITSTEWNNFYSLRNHHMAQPEFRELAFKMKAAHDLSIPNLLKTGEWHLPYVEESLELETSLKLSVSLCAQTSYRKSDDTIEKAVSIFDRLVTSKPVHASPTEHQAQALADPTERSGNFYGWLQYRQTIPDNVVLG